VGRDEVDEAGEPGVEVIAAQPVQAAGALVALADQARLGPLILFGGGIGMSFVAMAMAATHGVPAHQAGLASGLLNTTRQVGGAIGLAIMATAAASLARGLSGSHGSAAALTDGYRLAFLLAGLGLAAGMLLALALPAAARERRAAAADPASAGTPAAAGERAGGARR
jgi:hypothetical protein